LLDSYSQINKNVVLNNGHCTAAQAKGNLVAIKILAGMRFLKAVENSYL